MDEPPAEEAAHAWSRRDPRALWAAYIAMAFALLGVEDWLDAAIGGCATVSALWTVRGLLRPYRGAIAAYGAFVLIMPLVAGLGFGGSDAGSAAWLTFDAPRMLAMGLLLVKLFMIMLLGMPLLGLMTPYRLQQAIEIPLLAVAVPARTVRAVSLTVALLFRFMPLIAAEWARFARIAAARGKLPVLPGRMPLKRLHTVLIPFLLSLLLSADRLAVSLEIRGFGRVRGGAVRAVPLKLTRGDALFVLGAATLAAALWIAQRLM